MADENQITGKIIVETGDAQASMAAFISALQNTTQQMQNDFKKSADDSQKATQQISQSFDKLHNDLKSSISNMTSTIAKIGEAFLAVGTILAGGKIFKDLIQDVVDYVSSAKTLSKAMGTSINDAAAYIQAYKRVGVTHEQLEGVLKRFLVQIRTNSDMLRDKYGIDIEDIRKKGGGLTEMFERSKEVLRDYKEGLDQGAASQEIYGVRVNNVSQFLLVNVDSVTNAKKFLQSLGLTIGPEMEKQIRMFKAGLVDANTVLLALKLKIAQEVIPALVKMGQWVSGEGKTVIEGFEKALKVLGNTFYYVGKSIEYTVGMFNKLKAAGNVPSASGAKGGGGGGGWGGDGAAPAAGGEPEVGKGSKEWGDTKGGGGGGKGGGPGLLQQWKEELEKIKVEENAFLSYSKQAEKDFWETKLAQCKEGSKEYLAVKHELYSIDKSIQKDEALAHVAEIDRQIAEDKTAWNKKKALMTEEVAYVKSKWGEQSNEYRAVLKKQTALNVEYEKAQRDLADQRLDHQLKLDQMEIARKEQLIKFEEQMGITSGKTAMERLKQLKQEELQLEANTIAKKMALHKADEKAMEKLSQQLATFEKKKILEVEKAEQQAALKTKENIKSIMESVLGPIQSAIDTSITGMIQGTTTLSKAIANMGQSILTSFIGMLSQMLMKWIANQAMMLIINETTEETKKLASVTAEAAIAAAGGFASVMAAIPFPYNLAIAPEVAAGAFAATMSYAAASAAGGWWDVPQVTTTTLHPKEMVLPAWAAEGLRDTVGNGSGSDAKGGNNYSITISAVDAHSVEKLFMNKGASLVKSLNNQVRNFNRTVFK